MPFGRKTVVALVVLLCAGVLFWRFPLFHVVQFDAGDSAQASAAPPSAPVATARAFWTGQLPKVLAEAPDASTVLAAARRDPNAAAEQFGRQAGVSRSRSLLIAGSGRITEVTSRGVLVEVGISDSESTIHATVLLQTGVIVGNAVRDASGAFNESDFANSRQFNEISAELNRLVEAEVVPQIVAESASGREIRFAGCATVGPGARDWSPLRLVPVHVELPSS